MMNRLMRFIIFGSIIIFLVTGCAGSQKAQKATEKKLVTDSEAIGKVSPPKPEPPSPPSQAEGIKPQQEADAGAVVRPRASVPPVKSPPSPARPQAAAPSAPSVTPPKQAAPAPAPAPEKPKTGQGVAFKFDNADLYEVIRTIAELLKISYVIDPRVKGTVNIYTSATISQEDIFPIFLSILRMNGATIVKRDSIYEIVPFSEGKKLPLLIDEKKRLRSEDQFSMEIMKPNYIPIAELEKVIRPFLSDDKEAISFPQNNMLILMDLASNLQKVRDIVRLLDIDVFTDMTIRIYPIYNSDVNDVAKELGAIFSAFGIQSKDAKGGGVTFTPITRSNSLLMVSSMPNIAEKVENWIKELDKSPSDESKIWVHVVYVQNAKAKELAEVLKQVYTKGKETRPIVEPKQPTPTTPAPRTTQPARPAPGTPAPAPAPAAKEEPGRVAEGDINIVVDENNNALVIRALYRDYKAIMETIQKLDIYPKQVLIDVFLGEITLDDTTRFGVEWAKFAETFGSFANEINIRASPPSPIPPYLGGIRYSIVDAAGRVSAAISAAAINNRLKVLSSPQILASNNKEAKIQIGSEQPILTSTYTSTATTTSDVITGTIEYKDIGIILTVTPRISDGGLITMEVQIENSKVSSTTIGSENNLLTVPVFDKVTAKTTLSVLEGQVVIIGGLIKDQKDVLKTGIPFLSKIPILGALFGYQTYIDRRGELILLMTPHIITDAVQSKSVTEEFRRKLEELRKDIEEREMKMKK